MDRNIVEIQDFRTSVCRGSQEPRGSKFIKSESPEDPYGRGSQEPRGSKCNASGDNIRCSSRKSLVDRNQVSVFHRFRQPRGSKSKFNPYIKCKKCRGSQEPRGSKYDAEADPFPGGGRGSQEPRGSKSEKEAYHLQSCWSRLARASWIVISWHIAKRNR